ESGRRIQSLPEFWNREKLHRLAQEWDIPPIPPSFLGRWFCRCLVPRPKCGWTFAARRDLSEKRFAREFYRHRAGLKRTRRRPPLGRFAYFLRPGASRADAACTESSENFSGPARDRPDGDGLPRVVQPSDSWLYACLRGLGATL